MSRFPPLIALRAFEALGRTGSIRAAGDELGVSHTVVSRHIQNLENWLQTELSMPSGRGLSLTPGGARFHSKIVKAFELIQRATAELNRESAKTFEVWCTPGVATRRLLPQLTNLEAGLKDCEIILRPTLSRPSLESGEADAEIIYLFKPDNYEGRSLSLLASPRVFPVASPSFCARFGDVKDVNRLVELPLLHEESTDQWRRWLAAVGHEVLGNLHGPHLWHAHLATEAAKLGQGVALTNEILTAEELRSGELIELASSNVCLGSYYFISLDTRQHDPALAVFRNWLASIFYPAQMTGALNAPVAAN